MTFTQEHLAGRPDLVRRVFELGGVTFNGTRRGAECRVLCPFHDDHDPSMDVNVESGVFVCRACGAGGDAVEFYRLRLGLAAAEDAIQALRERLAIRQGTRIAAIASRKRYEIRDQDGTLIAIHERIDLPGGRKRFVWERDGKANLSGLKSENLPLYASERLAKADPSALVIVTEGEKATDTLLDRGFLAVGTVTGASGTPEAVALEVLRGRDVVLWPDFDEPGRGHMNRIGKALIGVARSVRVVSWGEQEKDDAFDFFARGGTEEQLDRVLAEAPEYVPEESPPADRTDESSSSSNPWEAWPTVGDWLKRDSDSGERLPTGLLTLDGATSGGIPRGRVVTFQSRPGNGKTALAKQLGNRAARAGALFVAVFADEGAEQASVMIGQDYGFERTKLEARDPETLAALAAALAPYEIRLPDPDDPETLLESIAERLKDVPPEKVIVLVCDSAQVVRCRGGLEAKSDRERITKFMEAARAFARSLRAIVIVISQTNRDSYRHKKESENIDPLAAGAESRAIEFCSDLLLHFTGDPEDVVTVKIVKNRLGPKKTFRLRFEPKTATFGEIDEKAAEAEREEEASVRKRASLAKAAERILDVLRKNPGICSEPLRDKAGINKTFFLEARRALEEKGRIRGTVIGRNVHWDVCDSERPTGRDE